MKFVDTARFTIESGKGGDGAVSFRHELYVPNGGPNGGDGGDGGDIVFVSDEGKSSLLDLKLRHEYEAQDGFKGDIKNMHGKDGKDMVLKVPVGTVLFNADTNEMIADFKENGQEEIFLRHIERCRVICHVIDMSGNYGTEDVIENYNLIRKELVNYNLKLDGRPEIIIANKIDLDEAKINLMYFEEQFKDKIIVPISGLKKENIDQLLVKINDTLATAADISLWDLNGFDKPDEDYKLYTFTPDTPDVKIINKGNGHWRVEGEDVLKIFQKTPISTHDNLLLFNEKLKTIGAYDELRNRGVQPGDMVEIYDIELEWME
jgi:Obg family GTPase CgtA-like protein